MILAGGLGLRLRPYTNDKPKAMVSVNGRPILEYQVEWLKANGVDNVVIACGYKHEVVEQFFKGGEKYGIGIKYSVEEKPLGTGGAIRRAVAKGGIKGTFVVSNGDTITSIALRDVLNFHRSAGGFVTVVIVPYKSSFGIVDIDGGGLVRGFREKPELPYWVNSGVYILEGGSIPYLPDEGSFESIALPQIAAQKRLFAYQAHGLWRPIDTAKDLVEAESELSKMPFKTLLAH